AIFVSLVVVGCATSTPSASAPASGAPSSAASPSSEPRAAGPTAGGEIVVSAFEDADTLDPTFSGTAGTRIVLCNMCEKLYDIDDSGAVVPQLAAESPAVDGLNMTIKLRDGVKFNDGTPFDAAAVVKSLERHRTHPESKRAGELGSVASVAVGDPST